MSLSWGQSLKRFRQLNQSVRSDLVKGMDKVTVRTGKYLKRRSEVRTPVDTGFAKRSWAMSESRKGSSASSRLKQVEVFNTATTAKNPRNRGKQGMMPGIYYLPWLEYGTINLTPRRFFRKAQMEAKKYQEQITDNYARNLRTKYNGS